MFDEVRTYSADEVYLTLAGYLVRGWDIIKVVKSEKTFSVVKGIRGKNTRVMNPNTHCIIQVVCPQTSITNRVFEQIVNADKYAGGGVNSLMLSDTSGFEIMSSTEAYVVNSADRTYGLSEGDRVWEIECLSSSFNEKGVNNGGANIFDKIQSLF